MSRFEFTSVLVSIVLAFALSELIALAARAVRREAGVVSCWRFWLLYSWLALSILLHWFGLWSYRDVSFERALFSFVLLAPPLTIAVVARSLNPEISADAVLDLRAHYERIRPFALPLAGLSMALSTLSDHLLPGVAEAGPAPYFLAGAATLASAGFIRNAAWQAGVLGANTLASGLVMVFARIA